MFFLKQKILIRGVKEHLADGLKEAADYRANFEPMFGWEDGLICSKIFTSETGGNWIELTDKDGLRHQFAHLAHLPRPLKKIGEKVNRGEEFAVSGNSGTPYWGYGTYAPHAHHQILKSDNTRIDPELFWKKKNMPTKTIYYTNESELDLATIIRLLNGAEILARQDGIDIIFLKETFANSQRFANLVIQDASEAVIASRQSGGGCEDIRPFRIKLMPYMPLGVAGELQEVIKTLYHEILHACWFDEFLGDIHSAGLGKNDNSKVAEIYLQALKKEKTNMIYVIDGKNNQYILVPEIKTAYTIGDPVDLHKLRTQGLKGEPIREEVPSDYLVFSTTEKAWIAEKISQLKDKFNV